MAECGCPPDNTLRDALSARLADLGDPNAVVVGYAIVVEVLTPDKPDTWLQTLQDHESSAWLQLGRVRALEHALEAGLEAGWEPDDE